MVFSNKIQQTQTQKLVMTTNLVQSLKILNMSRLELEEEIENEATSNPLLDVEINQNQVDWELYISKSRNNFNSDKNERAYRDESEFDFENLVKSKDSIYDNLHGQINIMYMEPLYKIVCNYIIDSLDKDGYLRIDINEISEDLKISLDYVNECLSIVQSLEPVGVGSRNLNECMIIQLKKSGMFTELLESIIYNDLNLVANLDVKKTMYKVSLKGK